MHFIEIRFSLLVIAIEFFDDDFAPACPGRKFERSGANRRRRRIVCVLRQPCGGHDHRFRQCEIIHQSDRWFGKRQLHRLLIRCFYLRNDRKLVAKSSLAGRIEHVFKRRLHICRSHVRSVMKLCRAKVKRELLRVRADIVAFGEFRRNLAIDTVINEPAMNREFHSASGGARLHNRIER
ncbi:hypothetical protein D3C80_295350 [compost metagenome]